MPIGGCAAPLGSEAGGEPHSKLRPGLDDRSESSSGERHYLPALGAKAIGSQRGTDAGADPCADEHRDSLTGIEDFGGASDR